MNDKRVLIADDHPVLLTGLAGLINGLNGFEIIASCANGEEALQEIRALKPDISILDFDMPFHNGLEIAEICKKEIPEMAVAILTLHKEESFLIRSIDIGVEGFMLKDFASDEIEKCLIALGNGDKFYSDDLKEFVKPDTKLPDSYNKLSRTERKIVRLIALNKTSKEIADLMFVSPKTVQNHRYNISKKLALEPKNNSLLSWANKFAKSL
tara:strand:- start:82942 stop:83574 length:633 start_codon:yes stop_codon:yes gene_type:complete